MTLEMYVTYLVRAITIVQQTVWTSVEHIYFIASISFICGYLVGRKRR
jgi:hypothetical protein